VVHLEECAWRAVDGDPPSRREAVRELAEAGHLEAVRGQEVDEQIRDLELLAAAMRDDEEPSDDPCAERQDDHPGEVRSSSARAILVQAPAPC
jgi:hypothetical protein